MAALKQLQDCVSSCRAAGSALCMRIGALAEGCVVARKGSGEVTDGLGCPADAVPQRKRCFHLGDAQLVRADTRFDGVR